MIDQQSLEQGSDSVHHEGGNTPAPLSSVVLGALAEMQVPVEVCVGSTRMSIRQLTDCMPGTVLTLDTAVGGLADLIVGGQLVARGELVAIDDQLGLRIVEIVTAEDLDGA